MNGTSFDALARRAVATVSRRASLFALGAAAVGATVSPGGVAAGGGCNCGKKCNKRCQAQSPQCAAAAANGCIGHPNSSLCESRCIACCFNLRNCEPAEVADSVQCLMTCVP
jgi:hypothetical protein